jgi:hypothetical protein
LAASAHPTTVAHDPTVGIGALDPRLHVSRCQGEQSAVRPNIVGIEAERVSEPLPPQVIDELAVGELGHDERSVTTYTDVAPIGD